MYILVFGLVGCLNYSWYGFNNATLTTIEKRFKIPSKNFGIISSGHEIAAIFTSVFLCYYASKKHKPRFMALGL
jgi:solute carrier organic anion transporter family, member 5A